MKISKDLKQYLDFAIVQVGENKSSNGYIKDCEEVDIITDVYYYPENITEFELKDELTQLQEFYDKVVVQLPLP